MSQFHALDGFLPAGALVMARRMKDVATGESPRESPSQALEVLRLSLTSCRDCRLCETRKTVVFGEGDPAARLVFVGEGPGETEDEVGRPFVGNAGELLDRMIGAIGLKREQVYILNVVKCRPPGDRTPETEEVAACAPYLKAQLAQLRPEVIVALGVTAAQALLGREVSIAQERGKISQYQGIPLMPTFHPSYLLRNPPAKREAWADLKVVAARLGIVIQ